MADTKKKEEWILAIHHDGFVCPHCGAVVVEKFIGEHTKWHDDLEKKIGKLPEPKTEKH